MRMHSILAGAALAAWSAAASASCFTVYNRANQIVFQSVLSPIDLSQAIGPATQRRFPGHHLVWSEEMDTCRELGGVVLANERSETAGRIFPAGVSANRSPIERSPLFQDIATGSSAIYGDTASGVGTDVSGARSRGPAATTTTTTTRPYRGR